MDRNKVISEIERKRGSKVISYFLGPNSKIAADAVEVLFKHLKIIGKVKNLDLYLHTTGGLLEIPLKIVYLMREFSEKFSVIIPYRAHSAGTLISLGADEIVMGKMGEFTPVDPQTMTPLNPKGAKGNVITVAVQDLISFFSFLDEIGVKNKEEIVVNLTNLLHPLVVGSVNRSWSLIKLIIDKLLTLSKYKEEEKKRIIDLLSGGLPSHRYLITRWEAREILGDRVKFADEELDEMMWELYEIYKVALNPFTPYKKDPRTGREIRRVTAAIIETSNSGSHFVQTLEKRMRPDGKVEEVPLQGGWVDFRLPR